MKRFLHIICYVIVFAILLSFPAFATDADVAAIKTDVDSIESSSTTIKNYIVNYLSELSVLDLINDKLTDISSDVSSIQSLMGIYFSDLANDVSSISTDIGFVETTIDSIYSRLGNMYTAQSTLTNWVVDTNTDTGNISTDTSSILAYLNSSTTAADHQTMITHLENIEGDTTSIETSSADTNSLFNTLSDSIFSSYSAPYIGKISDDYYSVVYRRSDDKYFTASDFFTAVIENLSGLSLGLYGSSSSKNYTPFNFSSGAAGSPVRMFSVYDLLTTFSSESSNYLGRLAYVFGRDSDIAALENSSGFVPSFLNIDDKVTDTNNLFNTLSDSIFSSYLAPYIGLVGDRYYSAVYRSSDGVYFEADDFFTSVVKNLSGLSLGLYGASSNKFYTPFNFSSGSAGSSTRVLSVFDLLTSYSNYSLDYLGRLAYVYANDDDIQLRKDVASQTDAATKTFFDPDSSSSVSDDDITSVGNYSADVQSMFDTGVSGDLAFSQLTDEDGEGWLWFSQAVADDLNTVPRTYSLRSEPEDEYLDVLTSRMDEFYAMIGLGGVSDD